MIRYTIKRLLVAIPTFFGITVLVFLLLNAAPGSIADLAAAEGGGAAEREALSAYLGLDLPLPLRYVNWMGNLLRGDFGASFRTGRAVSVMLAQRIVPTLILTGTGVVLAVMLALPLGVLSACRPRTGLARAASGLALVSFASPGFFMSLAGIWLLAVRLNVLPATGMYAYGTAGTLPDLLRHLVLPALVVCIGSVGGLIAQTRSACMEVLNEEYIKAARAKGIGERAVVMRHALRAAAMPILTAVLGHIPHLLGGAVVVERIFGWPGMGSLLFSAVSGRDYPVVMGVTVVAALAVLGTNILLDLLYALTDPRVTYEGR